MNLIFDRTQADVTYAAELNRKLGRGEALTSQELADWNAGLKGAYNAADMNRVDAAVRELGGMLTAAGYPVRYTSPVLPPEKPLKNSTLKSNDFQQAPYLYATGEHDTQYADDYISTKVMINVSASQKIYITTNVALLQDSGFVWYDKNRQFISGAKSEDISKYSMSATPPQNAQYCNININSTGIIPNNIQNVNVIYNGADDYIELTYIQSSGTQYIDTGYKPNNNTRTVVKVSNFPRTKTNQTLFGSRTGVGAADAYCFLTTSQNVYRTDYSSQTWNYDSSVNIADELLIEKNKNVTTLNGANSNTLATATFNSSHNLFISAMNNGGTPNFYTNDVKYYSVQIYDNGVLVRDYIPAIQNGRAGLYDKVESKMYYSNGTDDFIAGEAIITPDDTYEELEYIESTGTQYIDTGFLYASNCKIELDAEYTTNELTYFISAGYGLTSMAVMANVPYNSFNVMYGRALSYALELNKRRNSMVLNKNIFTANGEELVMTYRYFAISEPLVISAKIDTGRAICTPAKYYSCKIYDSSGVLQRDFVPARQNGEIGLYDKANKKFYPNAGTGEFLYSEKSLFNIGDIINYDIWWTYIDNVQAIRDAYYTTPDTPKLPEPTAPLNFDGANAIEKLLYDVQILYNAMSASYRKCGTFQAGTNTQRLPLQRSVT